MTNTLGHPQLIKIVASPSEFFPVIWGQARIKSFLTKTAIPEKKVYNYMKPVPEINANEGGGGDHELSLLAHSSQFCSD